MMSMIESVKRPSRRDALRVLGGSGLAALVVPGLGHGVATARADSLPRVVLEWFAAWTSADPARDVAALCAVDGTYEDIPSGASVLASDIESFLRVAPVRPATVNRYLRRGFVIDGVAVVDQLFSSTTQLFTGAPAGAPFEVFAVTLFEYDGQKLHRSSDYYVVDSILRQVGVPSANASPGEACQPAEPRGDGFPIWA